MNRILRHVVSSLAVLLFVAGCGSPTTPLPPETDPSEPARIEVTPGTLLLTSSGEEVQLSTQAYDHLDRPIDLDVTWTSLSPDTATVTQDGRVRAVSPLGSAQVKASAQGIESSPVLVLIAQPVAGAILVDDDQVVSGPTPDAAATSLELGLRYHLRIEGIDPPPVGSILLGRGELPVGGRVVASTAAGSASDVTLEIVPIEEMFAALRIDESLDLTHADVELPERVAAAFDVRRTGPGAYELVVDPSQEWSLGDGVQAQQAVGTRALGPFDCAIDPSITSLDLKDVVLRATQSLTFDFHYDGDAGGLQRAVAHGHADMELGSTLMFTAAAEGKLTCKGEIFQVTIPIGGPLALIVGGHVPVGAGFESTAKVTVAQVGFKARATSEHSLALGIDCTGPDAACAMVNTYDQETDGTFELIIPDPTSQLRIEHAVYAFGFVDLAIGNRFFKQLRFTAFSIKAGLKQSSNLAPIEVQAADDAYASGLKLELEFSAGVGTDLVKLLDLLTITLNTSLIKETAELAASPVGTIERRTDHDHATPVHVRPTRDGETGDLVEFIVELDKRTYFGIDLVESITLLKRTDEGELVSFSSDCEGITASETSFTCTTDVGEDHIGDNEIYAFIDVQLFGVPLPIGLEIAPKGMTELAVDPEPTLHGVTIVAGDVIPADTPTLQEFKFDWEDAGENLTLVVDRFLSLPSGFEATFEDEVDNPEVAEGFTGPDGIGTYRLTTFVDCLEDSDTTLRDRFVLVDEYGHESEEFTVDSTVDYSGCEG